MRDLLVTFSILLAVSLPVRAQSEAERLERLERAVERLQQRNSELEAEVRALKAQKSAPPAAKPETAANEPIAGRTESKAEVEKKEVKKEEKKGVPVFAAASEFKLTLGGFIQAQFEGGDVFAFEGRFARGTGEIKDRFRLRRSRITLTGDYKEDFDFKIEGDFAFSDTAITVRDAAGRTLGSNSTRTAFSATDIFVNWHTYPEFNIKVGQY